MAAQSDASSINPSSKEAINDRARDRQRRIQFHAKVREEHRSGAAVFTSGVFLEHDNDSLADRLSSHAPLSSIDTIASFNGNWSNARSPLAPRQGTIYEKKSQFLGNLPYPSLPTSFQEDEKHEASDRFRTGQNLVSVLNSPEKTTSSFENIVFRNFWDDSDAIDPLEIKSLPYVPDLDGLKRYLKKFGVSHREWTSRRNISFGDLISFYSPVHSHKASRSLKIQRMKKLSDMGRTTLSHLSEDVERCLQVIPSFYLEEEFDVKSPEFFNSVSQNQNSFSTQEKLSYYLDLVEVSILNQISVQSESFFSALCTVQDLYVQVSFMYVCIKKLRIYVRNATQEIVRQPMGILRKQRRLRNQSKLLEYLELISTVQNSIQTVKALMSSGEYSYAIDMVHYTERIISKDLKEIHCLKGFKSKLTELKSLLIDLLLADFSALSVFRSDDFSLESQETHMAQLVLSAARLGDLSPIPEHFANSVKKSFSLIFSTLQIDGKCIMDEGRDWEKVELNDFCDMIELFISETKPFILHVAETKLFMKRVLQSPALYLQESEANNTSWKIESGEFELFSSRIDDAVSTVCEFILSKLTEILSFRSIDTLLCVWDVKQIFDLSMKYVCEIEELSNCSFYKFRTYMLNQARGFLNALHENSIRKLSNALDSESWTRVRVKRKYQKLVDNSFVSIIASPSASVREPEHHKQQSDDSSVDRYRVLDALRTAWWDSDTGISGAIEPSDGLKGMDSLIVGEEKFRLVESSLRLLELVSGYMDCAVLLNIIGSETVHRLVQIFNTFNSRTCQLILGAGAMQLAGLKSITARHLALASQSLGMVIAIIPKIKASLETHISSNQSSVLKELDRVMKDYSDHQSEILDKLIKIMHELIELSCSKIASDLRKFLSQKQSNSRDQSFETLILEVHSSVEKLIQQTHQLNRVLSPLLTPTQIDKVWNSIFLDYGLVFNKWLNPICSIFPELPEQPVQQSRAYLSIQVSYLIQSMKEIHIVNDVVFKELSKWIVEYN